MNHASDRKHQADYRAIEQLIQKEQIFFDYFSDSVAVELDVIWDGEEDQLQIAAKQPYVRQVRVPIQQFNQAKNQFAFLVQQMRQLLVMYVEPVVSKKGPRLHSGLN